jgi:hypothetical protein
MKYGSIYTNNYKGAEMNANLFEIKLNSILEKHLMESKRKLQRQKRKEWKEWNHYKRNEYWDSEEGIAELAEAINKLPVFD